MIKIKLIILTKIALKKYIINTIYDFIKTYFYYYFYSKITNTLILFTFFLKYIIVYLIYLFIFYFIIIYLIIKYLIIFRTTPYIFIFITNNFI